MPLLGRNVHRNFPTGDANVPIDVVTEECIRLRPGYVAGTATNRGRVLYPPFFPGATKDQEAHHGPHDIILGADVVPLLL